MTHTKFWPWAVDEGQDINGALQQACHMYEHRFGTAPTLILTAPGLIPQPPPNLHVQENFMLSPKVFYFVRPQEGS